MKIAKAKRIAVDGNHLVGAVERDQVELAVALLKVIIQEAQAMLNEYINEGVAIEPTSKPSRYSDPWPFVF